MTSDTKVTDKAPTQEDVQKTQPKKLEAEDFRSIWDAAGDETLLVIRPTSDNMPRIRKMVRELTVTKLSGQIFADASVQAAYVTFLEKLKTADEDAASKLFGQFTDVARVDRSA
jgi:hypothetical protein